MTSRPRRPGTIHISAPSFPLAPRPTIYRKIAYTFLGLTVVILLAVLWLTSVRAEVVVQVRRDDVKLEHTVEVAQTPAGGQIPGRVVRDTFERVQEFTVKEAPSATTEPVPTPEPAPAPEPTRLPDDQVRARGTVKIVNKYSKNQVLVATTRLESPDKKLYRIEKRVEVPPGGSATVAVYADQTGYAYAIGPSKFTIPGLYDPLEVYIYAESSEAFEALPIEGEKLPTPVASTPPSTPAPVAVAPVTTSGKRVTVGDIEEAERALMEEVVSRAKSDLSTRAAVPDWDVVYLVRVVDKKTNATVGQVTDTFLSSLKLEVTAVYYPKEDMQALVRTRLRERIPEGREILSFGGEEISYSVESADPDTGVAKIQVAANASYRLSAESPLLQPTVVAGKSKAEAERILRSIDGVESVTITIRPSWLGTIPSIKDKITMTIQ